MSKPIVLFDMDGTLSPARQPIIDGMLEKLIELSLISDIGIVTGSGITYIKQQCSSLINNIGKFDSSLTLFPCNGTQVYKISSPSNLKCVFSENMRMSIGEVYNEIIGFLLQEQHKFISSFSTNEKLENIRLSGTFVQYRNSMLNWCPIGRDASGSDRATFEKIDEKQQIRQKMVDTLERKKNRKEWPVQFALGGATSIDIYPEGWDKTFALKHINESDRDVYFVGDRCKEGGNDYTIYEKINLRNMAYETTSPQQTIQIINKIQKSILS